MAEQGAFAKGRELGDEMVRLAEAIGHPFSLSCAYYGIGHLYLRHGDFDKAIPALERSLEVSQVGHIRLLIPSRASTLGYAYALAGRVTETLPLLEQAVERAAAMRFIVLLSLWVTQLSEAYLLAGRMEEAFTQALRTLELSRAHQERDMRPGSTGSWVISTRIGIPRQPSKPQPPTSRPSPWPRNSGCARSRPTATVASACCIRS
jgi:tetratricopeptide (TPR) repeat protein